MGGEQQQLCHQQQKDFKKRFGRRREGKNNNQTSRKSLLFRKNRRNNNNNNNKNEDTSVQDLSLLLEVIKHRMNDDSFSLDEGDKNNISALMKEVLASSRDQGKSNRKGKDNSFSSTSTAASSFSDASNANEAAVSQLANVVMTLLVKERNATDTGVPSVAIDNTTGSDNDISTLLYPEKKEGEDGGIEHTAEELERVIAKMKISPKKKQQSQLYDTSQETESSREDDEKEESPFDAIMDAIAALVPDALLFPDLMWDPQEERDADDSRDQNSRDYSGDQSGDQSYELASEYDLSDLVEQELSHSFASPTPTKKKNRGGSCIESKACSKDKIDSWARTKTSNHKDFDTTTTTSAGSFTTFVTRSTSSYTTAQRSNSTMGQTPEAVHRSASSCMDYLKDVESMFCRPSNTPQDDEDEKANTTASIDSDSISVETTMQSLIPGGALDYDLTNYFGVQTKEGESMFGFAPKEEEEDNYSAVTAVTAVTAETQKTTHVNLVKKSFSKDDVTIEPCFIEVPPNGEVNVMDHNGMNTNGLIRAIPADAIVERSSNSIIRGSRSNNNNDFDTSKVNIIMTTNSKDDDVTIEPSFEIPPDGGEALVVVSDTTPIKKELPSWVMPEDDDGMVLDRNHSSFNQLGNGGDILNFPAVGEATADSDSAFTYSKEEIIDLADEFLDSQIKNNIDGSFEYSREEFMNEIKGILDDTQSAVTNSVHEDSFEYSIEDFIGESPDDDDDETNHQKSLEDEKKKKKDSVVDDTIPLETSTASFVYQEKSKEHPTTTVIRGTKVALLVKHFNKVWLRLQRKKGKNIALDQERLNYSTDSSTWNGDSNNIFSTDFFNKNEAAETSKEESAKELKVSLFGPAGEEGEDDDNKENKNLLYALSTERNVNISVVEQPVPKKVFTRQTRIIESTKMEPKKSVSQRKSNGKASIKKKKVVNTNNVASEPPDKRKKTKKKDRVAIASEDDDNLVMSPLTETIVVNHERPKEYSARRKDQVVDSSQPRVDQSIAEELLLEGGECDNLQKKAGSTEESVISSNWSVLEQQRIQSALTRSKPRMEEKRYQSDEKTQAQQEAQNQRSVFRRNKNKHSVQETNGMDLEVVVEEGRPHSTTKRSAMSGAVRSLMVEQEKQHYSNNNVTKVEKHDKPPLSSRRHASSFSSRRKQSQRLTEAASSMRSRRLARLHKAHQGHHDVTPKKSNINRSKSSPRPSQISEKDQIMHSTSERSVKPRSKSFTRLKNQPENEKREESNKNKKREEERNNNNLTIVTDQHHQWEPFKTTILKDIGSSTDPSPTSIHDAAFTHFMPEAFNDTAGFDADTSFPPF